MMETRRGPPSPALDLSNLIGNIAIGHWIFVLPRQSWKGWDVSMPSHLAHARVLPEFGGVDWTYHAFSVEVRLRHQG
jgi:hypothetical protein